MKIDLTLENKTNEEIQNFKNIFVKIIKRTLKKLKIKNKVSLSVSFVSDETIKLLNKEYRQIDKSTDVLSFVFNEQLDEEELTFYLSQIKIKELGDIVINYNQAKQQALQYNHSLTREVCFLFTHGLLHLLGFDHKKIDDEKNMFCLQEEILKELKINKEGESK